MMWRCLHNALLACGALIGTIAYATSRPQLMLLSIPLLPVYLLVGSKKDAAFRQLGGRAQGRDGSPG